MVFVPDTVLSKGRSGCRLKVAEVPVVENNRFVQLGADKIEIRSSEMQSLFADNHGSSACCGFAHKAYEF